MRRSSTFSRLLIFGILAIIAGLGVGISSHQVSYQSVGQDTIAHYLSAQGTGYLQLSSSSTLYLVNEDTFTPTINGIKTFVDGDKVSLIYEPDSTTDIDEQSTLGTHLVGKAYTVVQITRYDGAGQSVYNTSTYAQNPQGYMKSNWGAGAGLLLLGLILTGVAFLVRSRTPQTAFNVTSPPAMGMPPAGMPYQQPYQGVAQYPQYPPQGSPYQPTMPASPYGQPQYPSYPPQPG
ncbi:MAG: hypothetical protein JOZ18_11245, partial [Chloroflexi bacterium]|nr:hypothetical protein [Chloroflexota bacterium]